MLEKESELVETERDICSASSCLKAITYVQRIVTVS